MANIVKPLSDMSENTKMYWEPKRTWVFAVGVLEFDSVGIGGWDKKGRLDAKLIKYLHERGVPEKQKVFLQDTEATLVNIRQELERFLPRAERGDLLFFYYAGHGGKNDLSGTYFLPYDGRKTAERVKMEKIWSVCEFIDNIDKQFGGSLVILTADCCLSGSVAELLKSRHQSKSYAVITSSLFNEESTGNWTFTEYLLNGWRGDADLNGDGCVTLAELGCYVREKMWEKEKKTGQTVTFETFGRFNKGMVLTCRRSEGNHF